MISPSSVRGLSTDARRGEDVDGKDTRSSTSADGLCEMSANELRGFAFGRSAEARRAGCSEGFTFFPSADSEEDDGGAARPAGFAGPTAPDDIDRESPFTESGRVLRGAPFAFLTSAPCAGLAGDAERGAAAGFSFPVRSAARGGVLRGTVRLAFPSVIGRADCSP